MKESEGGKGGGVILELSLSVVDPGFRPRVVVEKAEGARHYVYDFVTTTQDFLPMIDEQILEGKARPRKCMETKVHLQCLGTPLKQLNILYQFPQYEVLHATTAKLSWEADATPPLTKSPRYSYFCWCSFLKGV